MLERIAARLWGRNIRVVPAGDAAVRLVDRGHVGDGVAVESVGSDALAELVLIEVQPSAVEQRRELIVGFPLRPESVHELLGFKERFVVRHGGFS